jgi:hypothetical protein
VDTEEYLTETHIRQAASKADAWFPGLTQYAPSVGITAMKNRPDVAGFYDHATKSVQVNSARATQLEPDQLAGLIALERTRGHLFSPEGQPWLQAFPLPQDQQQWWKRYYIDTAGDAPEDETGQANIIKGTILSRLMVGDTLPKGAPPLTSEQQIISDKLHAHYRGKK